MIAGDAKSETVRAHDGMDRLYQSLRLSGRGGPSDQNDGDRQRLPRPCEAPAIAPPADASPLVPQGSEQTLQSWRALIEPTEPRIPQFWGMENRVDIRADGIDRGNACRRSCPAEKGGWKCIDNGGMDQRPQLARQIATNLTIGLAVIEANPNPTAKAIKDITTCHLRSRFLSECCPQCTMPMAPMT
jgi:hypothetical protein